MASNSNRKLNSSGSNAAKPTFRRATASKRSSSAASRAPRSTAAAKASKPAASRHTIGSYTATPGKGFATKQRTAARPAGAKPARRGAAKPVAASAAQRSVANPVSTSTSRRTASKVAAPSAPSARAKTAAKQRGAGGAVSSRPVAGKKAAPVPASSSGAARRVTAKSVSKKRLSPRMTPGRSLTSVAGPTHPAAPRKPHKAPAPLAALAGAVSSIHIPVPKIPAKVLAAVVSCVVVVGIVAAVVVNSALFTPSTIIINGSEHVPQATVEQLIDIPAGTTLLNVNEDAIAASLTSNPWIAGVTVERSFPDTLTITPKEREVAAIAYIGASDIAWAIGSDNTWISPMSLAVTVDASGAIVSDGTSATGSATLPEDPAATDGATDTGDTDAGDAASGDATSGTDGSAAGDGAQAGDANAQADGTAATGGDTTEPAADGTQQLSGLDAALALTRRDGAVLFIDVAADVDAASGREVTSDVILAGLEYARGFSPSFIEQIKDISLSSLEAISANLTSGVEVLLGEPEDISLKETVITRLLGQEQGVTYINVRTPDNYTFRSAE